MAITTAASEFIIKTLFTDETPSETPPAAGAFFVALHTGNPGDDGTANEVTVGADPDYVRKAVTLDAAVLAGGRYRTENAADVVFDPAGLGANYTVTHISLFDAATSGVCWAVIPLTIPRAIVEGDVIRIPTTELRVTGDV
jgi:hypothetical protein